MGPPVRHRHRTYDERAYLLEQQSQSLVYHHLRPYNGPIQFAVNAMHAAGGAGCRVGCVLEGWNIDDNTDVPGDTLFYDMVYKSYGGAP